MRVIKQNSPGAVINRGTVVFHAGANVAQRWDDFREYSKADREFFDKLLLPIDSLDFNSSDELEVDPIPKDAECGESFNVCDQDDIRLQEIPLIEDPQVQEALRVLREKGCTLDQLNQDCDQQLQPIQPLKIRQRQAKRRSLDDRVKAEAGKILARRSINPKGYELDRRYLSRPNFVVLKSAIDRQVNAAVGRQPGERHEFTQPELDQIDSGFSQIIDHAVKEVFDVKN